MPQLAGVGRGMSPPTHGGGGGIQPVTYEAESQAYFTNLEATGLTLSTARKYTLNRAIKRWKAAGLHTKVDFGIAAGNAAAFAVTAFGLVTCTMVGTPTYSNFAVSTASNSNYYEIDKQFKDIPATNHSMGFLATAGATASGNSDMGVLDGTIRCAINSKITTTNLFNGASFTAATGMGTAAQASGSGFNAISRHSATPGTFYNYVNGINRASSATAAGSTVSTNKVRILMLGGGSTVSSRSMASWFFGEGLTHDEMVQVYAILKSVDNVLRYGEPQIQDYGQGDAIVEADVVVYGLDVAGVNFAYEATRHGRTAILLGSPRDTSHEHIGYNPIGWVDATDRSTISGLCRAIITAANTQLGVSDTSDQQGCSIHPMRWNRVARQMLDPTRASATLPGADIKVFLSGGLSSVTMTTTAIGREFTEIVAADGRIIRPLNGRMIVVEADYNGDIKPLAGISYTQGTEAAGSAPGEDLNGYDPTALFPLRDSEGTAYNSISSYIEEDNAASGLLPNIIELPSTPAGDPDFILQPMNYRFCLTSSASRMAPMTGGATLAEPEDYDPLEYEVLGRLFAAYEPGYTAQMSDVYSMGDTIEGASGSVIDSNNGSSGSSTDLAQSGLAYLQAANNAEREAAITHLTRYSQGIAYWILASGDPRIPASLITELQGWGLDTSWGVDPYPGHPLFFPPHPYYREPVYQMRNTFNFNAHDTFATDGTTPRSTKTVACASYRADRHTTRLVNVSGNVRRQGGINDDEAGGVNNRSPVPYEAFVPDKAECANFFSLTAPAWSKVAGASGRMAPVFQMLGQSGGIAADHALTDEVAVQDVSYGPLRTAILAVPDAVTPVIPQTN